MNVLRSLGIAVRNIFKFPGHQLSRIGLAQNHITGMIGFYYTIMIVVGVALLVMGTMFWGFIGVIMAALAIIGLTYGWTSFDPPTEGILMRWNRIVIDEHGNTTTIKGDSILANFWPFFISAKAVDMTRKEWKFEMKVQSARKVLPSGQILPSIPVKGVIEMTAFPLSSKMVDYNASGGMDNIYKELGKIPYQVVQDVVTAEGLSFLDMAQKSGRLIELVDRHLNGTATTDGYFKQKRYGVTSINVRGDFPVPPEIEKTMLESASIIYENEARKEEYAADIEAAKQFNALGLVGKEATDAATEARLVRDGRVTRLQIEGKGTAIGGILSIHNPQFHMPSDQGNQGQNQGGRRNRRQNRQGGTNQGPQNQNPTP